MCNVEKPETTSAKNDIARARIDSETNRLLNEYCIKNSTTRTEVVRKGIELRHKKIGLTGCDR